MFRYLILTEVNIFNLIILASILSALFFLREPLALMALILLRQPSEQGYHAGADADGQSGMRSIGFVQDE
ncbi:hypothetical protein [Ectothiorhodospira shaposhnikovii]|uniref:hypothetical protein n=1 Tax=Ectothiorhodospira shaposhnikovii TaxID=1054 RepID=UPI001EE7A8A8|nr:hypothetical protein [Ectothiorhodospira shaposhnikovii]MCG5512838.1 hypothetical protein [Ectothiorhodospira shaposhnikovii]